jgi:hypothetical protein
MGAGALVLALKNLLKTQRILTPVKITYSRLQLLRISSSEIFATS